jgi:hypothetical protein
VTLRIAARSAARSNLTSAMAKFGIFRDTEMATDCDECGGRVDLLKGGACVRCRRILCFRHLHGSFVRRLATDLGAQMLCVRCRAAGRDARVETDS